jgi:hypothetical protein
MAFRNAQKTTVRQSESAHETAKLEFLPATILSNFHSSTFRTHDRKLAFYRLRGLNMYMIGVARVRGPHMGDHHIDVPSVTGHSLSQSKAVWEEEAEIPVQL